MSGSNAEMSALAGSLAKSLGWRVEPKYTEDVTHVVCGTVQKTNKAKVRSAKFLRAVASGKWVLTESWLQECKRRRARAEEEAFEVSGDKKSPASGQAGPLPRHHLPLPRGVRDDRLAPARRARVHAARQRGQGGGHARGALRRP
ncbi:unnamed protein product [Scytosiphon promiscuus]